MSKALLYAGNSTSQTVADGGIINFGSAIRRFGCNIDANGGNPTISGVGYYTIDGSITFSTAVGVVGDVTMTLYQNGAPIPGSSVTRTVAALMTYNMQLPTVARNKTNTTSTITAVISGADVTVTNATIRIIKE